MLVIEEFVHIVLDESIIFMTSSDTTEETLENLSEPNIENLGLENNTNIRRNQPKECKYASNHPQN